MALDKLDIAMLEDVGTGANQLVQLDGSAKLPALDASNLTNLNTSELSGGLPPGDGSAFTNITAGNINGIIPDASFPTILPARNAQALTDINAANISGTLPATINLAGVGSAITALTAGNIVGSLPIIDGNALTNLNADNLGTGILPDARFPALLPGVDGSQLQNVPALLVGDGSALTLLNGSAIATGTVDSARLDTGVTAGNVIMVAAGDKLPQIDGSDLINVPALLVGDGSALTLLNGSAIASGTVDSARLDTGVTAGNVIMVAAGDKLPQIDGSDLINVPALLVGDGSALTLLNGSAIASGTLDGARFPTNLPAVDGSALTNLTATNLTGSIPLSNLVVKQVLSYTKANAFDTTSDTFVDVTDMEISVTTTQINSRLLIFGHLALSATSNYSWGGWHVRLTRDGTVMTVGTDLTQPPNESNPTSGTANDEYGVMGGLTRSDPLHATHPAPFQEVDSPQVAAGTTLVYKVQLAATHLFTGSLCTVYVNRSASPGAVNGSGVGVSTITVLEVAA
jgi:LysM repeat protein